MMFLEIFSILWMVSQVRPVYGCTKPAGTAFREIQDKQIIINVFDSSSTEERATVAATTFPVEATTTMEITTPAPTTTLPSCIAACTEVDKLNSVGEHTFVDFAPVTTVPCVGGVTGAFGLGSRAQIGCSANPIFPALEINFFSGNVLPQLVDLVCTASGWQTADGTRVVAAACFPGTI